jgi:hypothetical protein
MFIFLLNFIFFYFFKYDEENYDFRLVKDEKNLKKIKK